MASGATENHKALVRRFVEEVWNRGDLAVAEQVLAPTYVEHASAPEGPHKDKETPGPEGVKQFVAQFRRAFPDLRFTIHDLIAEGDRVAMRVTARGTHRGEFMGFPPTGRQVKVSGFAIHHIVGDRIAETYAYVDRTALRDQLAPER